MLATVLKGDLAEQQSIYIMRAFKEMQKMDGIVMIRGLACRYMEKMEMLKDTIFSGEDF